MHTTTRTSAAKATIRTARTATLVILSFAGGCGGGAPAPGPDPAAPATATDDGHAHGPDADHTHEEDSGHGAHDHDVEPLGAIALGDLQVELAQGHGPLAAGREAHLVVKLPYSDAGATVVRAWIGTDDRTLSYVGRGEYAAGHDDYDVHATAPDPLPRDARWWVELELPDGARVLGSAAPIRE